MYFVPASLSCAAFRAVSFLLIQVLFLSSVMGLMIDSSYASGIVVDRNAPIQHRPGVVESRGNGSGVKVPVVNITRPSAGGTSRNAFMEYNVGSEGVILNNSAVGVNSVSGGRVRGNRNLSAGKEASVIVNEVTGGNASRLAGMTEVVGKDAAVVVANPNGVTCDGCSFYKTPQVVLSTGAVQVDGEGNLVGLGVERGTVSVGAGGLRASTATDVELIGRKVIVDGAVRVNPQGKLGVRGGRQQYNTVTGESTGAAADASRIVPAVAIDATAVGAMQAGQIHIMSTESGAGVRLDGDMAANAGDITIDANGNIVMGREDAPRASITARKDIKITSTGSVTKHSHSYSYEDTKVVASGDFTNTGRLDGQDDVAIDVKGKYTNTGKLDAGKDMALTVGGAMHNSGYVDVGRDLRIRGAGDVTNDNVRITVGNQADIQLAGSLLNQDSDMFAFGGMDVRAANMVHRGVAYLGSQGSLSVTVVRDLLNLDDGSLIQSGGDMSLVAGGLIDNRNGSIISLSNLSITAGSLNNDSGIISAEGNSLSIAVANGLTNRFGLINSNGTLSITTGALDNSDGAITSAGGSAIASRGDIINERGLIHSNSTLNISAADKLNNREGVINAHGAAAIQTANSIDNSLGLIQSNDTLAMTAGGDLINALGQIGAVNDVSLTVAGQLDNFIGEVASDSGSLLLNLGGISDNRGGILASAKDFTLNANGDLDISQGMVSSKDGVLTLTTTGKLVAQGSVLTSGSDMQVTAQGDANLTGLELRSGGGATLTADDIILSNALVLSDEVLSLTAQGSITGGTSYLSATDIVAQAGGSITQTGSIWYAPDAINIMAQSGDLNLSGGQVVSEDIALQSSGLLTLTDAVLGAEATSQGLLQVAKQVTADAGSVEANRLVALVGEDGFTLNSNGNTTAQDALIVSSGDVSMNSGGLLNLARSEVTSVDSLTLNATGDITTDSAQLAGNAGVEITSTNGNWSNLGTDGMIQSGTGTVSIAANAMDTEGSILSPEGMSLKTRNGDMLLGGLVYSSKDMVLESGLRLQNRGGQIQVGQGLQMRANGDVVNSAGGILAVQNGISLQLAQGGFINDNASIITPGLINLVVHSLSNSNGTIQSGNGLNIATTNGINNSNGTIASYGASPATISASNGAITNTNGTIASASSLHVTGNQGIANTGGTLQANTTLTLSANNGGITNQGGSIQAGGDVSSNASWHDNSHSGKILSGGNIALTSTGNESLATNLSNGNGGLIQAVGNITAISQGRIGNQGGTYQAGGLLTLQAQGRIDNSGNGMLVSGNNMNVTSQDYITNNVNGLMLSGGDMTIRTGLSGIDNTQTFAFNNHQGTVQSGGLLNLTTRNLDNYLGTMQSDDTLTIVADNQDRSGTGIRNDGGLIQSGWDMSITTDYSIGNINGGEIRALRDATIQVELDLNNSYLNNPGGLIEAGNNLSISNTGAGHVYNENGGRLEAGNLLSIVLAKEHRNPAYDQWLAASAQCTADPDCDPTTLAPKPQEFIRGKIYNSGGQLNATILFTQVNAIINDNRSAPNGTSLSAFQTAPNNTNNPNNVSGVVSNITNRSTSSAVAAVQGAITKQNANPNGTGSNGGVQTANNVGIMTSTTRYQESQRIGEGYQYTDQYRPSTSNTASNTAPQARATPPSDITQLAAYNAEQRKLNQVASIQNYAESLLDPTKLSGTISAQMWTGNVGDLSNRGGTINVDFIDINAKNIFNEAVIADNGSVIRGKISGDYVFLTASGTVSNIGGKISGKSVLVDASSVINDSLTKRVTTTKETSYTCAQCKYANNGTETTTRDEMAAQGAIVAEDGLTVKARDGLLLNRGKLDAGEGILTLEGKDIRNKLVIGNRETEIAGLSPSGGPVLTTMTAQEAIGGGILRGKQVQVNAEGGSFVNRGTLEAKDGGYIKAKDVSNTAQILHLTETNDASMMYNYGSKSVQGHAVAGGQIMTDGMMSIIATGTVTNSGSIMTGDGLYIKAKDIINTAVVTRATADNGKAFDDTVRAGTGIMTSNKVVLQAENNVINTAGGIASTDGPLTIMAGATVNDDGSISYSGQGSIINSAVKLETTDGGYHHPITFVGGTLASGGKTTLIAGDSIINQGSSIGGYGDVTLLAQNHIVSTAVSDQYITKNKQGGFMKSSSLHTKAVIGGADITSGAGNIVMETQAGDIKLLGTGVSAGALNNAEGGPGNVVVKQGETVDLKHSTGVIYLKSGQDIILDAVVQEEIHQRSKSNFIGLGVAAIVTAVSCVYAGCSGLALTTTSGGVALTGTGMAVAAGVTAGSIAGGGTLASHSDTEWNDHNLAFTTLSGSAIYLDAKRDVIGEGVLFNGEQDGLITAGHDVDIKSEKVTKYIKERGWTLSGGVSIFGGLGTNTINAMTDGDDPYQAIVSSNQTLKVVDNLKNTGSSFGMLNPANAGIQAWQILASPDPLAFVTGGYTSKDGVLGSAGKSLSVNVSLGVHSSETKWTESYLSQFTMGGKMDIRAGNDLTLSGTGITANGINLYAGHNLNVIADADEFESSSKGVGASFNYGASGYGGGLNANWQKSEGTTYNYANLDAGSGKLTTYSGNDTNIRGADLKGAEIDMTVLGNLTVASLQNQSHSSGGGFSASYNDGNGAFGGSVNGNKADRERTDNITSIIGSDKVTINVKGNTHVEGATIANAVQNEDGSWTDLGKLQLTTGTLTYKHLSEQDDSLSMGVGFNHAGKDGKDTDGRPVGSDLWKKTGSLYGSEKDTDGTTYATIGNGTINITNGDDQDLTVLSEGGINRDINSVQTITVSQSEGEITVPLNMTPEAVAAANAQVAANVKKATDWAKSKGLITTKTADGKVIISAGEVGDEYVFNGKDYKEVKVDEKTRSALASKLGGVLDGSENADISILIGPNGETALQVGGGDAVTIRGDALAALGLMAITLLPEAATAGGATAGGGTLAAGATACIASVGCGIVVATTVVVIAGVAATAYVLMEDDKVKPSTPGVTNVKGGSVVAAGGPGMDPNDPDQDPEDFDPYKDDKDYSNANFRDGELDTHYNKHANEWNGSITNQQQYLEGARKLLNKSASDNIQVYVRANGDILKYNVANNELVIGNAQGQIRTFFRPVEGMRYWNNLIGK